MPCSVARAPRSRSEATETATAHESTTAKSLQSPAAIIMKKLLSILAACTLLAPSSAQEAQPFGSKFPQLDGMATGQWWEKAAKERARAAKDAKSDDPRARRRRARRSRFVTLDVPRKDVIAFALYTHDAGVLKMSAQLYPLLPDETRLVRLEVRPRAAEGAERKDASWREVGRVEVVELGWSAHFRVSDWDATRDFEYRVLHGRVARFTGVVRKDPIAKDEIVIANMSCNSSRTPGQRPRIVDALRAHDPDLLFFAGDQTYHHTQHTAGWIQFGLQFRDVLRDRPVITIPDDHDVGQANIWGENGKKAATSNGPSGGYFYPPRYVNMVQRQQTWLLPDPHDATPIERGITVYYTRLRVGGIDFAIVEDRKFKSGPKGKIPKMGPRPDHINDPKYDRKAVDLPGLKLLGDRQLRFLDAWSADWRGAQHKVVLSQTAFCGAVHMHGRRNGRLLADLDSNAWPQRGRNAALRAIRRARAIHLCGDQHLAVVVRHGIDAHGDGPYAFTSPALVNTIYGRWWHPEDEKAGPGAREDCPLPWTGDYLDGLGNRITMLAYANPEDTRDERKRADGYGIVRIRKSDGRVRFECWPRFSEASGGASAQFPGWPVEFRYRQNEGRRVVAKLAALEADAVVQVRNDASGEVLYTVREAKGWEPPVFSKDAHSVWIGEHAGARKRR